jgi:hypothetical protein
MTRVRMRLGLVLKVPKCVSSSFCRRPPSVNFLFDRETCGIFVPRNCVDGNYNKELSYTQYGAEIQHF